MSATKIQTDLRTNVQTDAHTQTRYHDNNAGSTAVIHFEIYRYISVVSSDVYLKNIPFNISIIYQLRFHYFISLPSFKGGYLDFLQLTELEIYISLIFI